VRSIVDDLIEIYDARMRERESTLDTNNEQNERQELKRTTENPKSIQNRVRDTWDDIHILGGISGIENTVDSVFRITENIKSTLKKFTDRLNAKRTEESTTENTSTTDSSSSDSTEMVWIPLEQYLALKNRVMMKNNEESTTTDNFSTDSSTETPWIPKQMNMHVLIEKFLAWKNRTNNESNEESTPDNISTEDVFTDSNFSERISHNGELTPKEDVLTYILNKYYSLKNNGLIKSDTSKIGSVKASLNSVMESYKKWKESEKRT